MYVCLCKGLTNRDVDRCVGAGHCSGEALIAALGLEDAGTCGRCRREIRQCGPAAWRGGASAAAGAAVRGQSLVDGTRVLPGIRAAERAPACGLTACGASLCAACASRSVTAATRPGAVTG